MLAVAENDGRYVLELTCRFSEPIEASRLGSSASMTDTAGRRSTGCRLSGCVALAATYVARRPMLGWWLVF